MSPGSTRKSPFGLSDEEINQSSWKVLFYRSVTGWLLNQGLSTILLFCLVATLVYGGKYVVPEHIKLVQSGYELIADKHESEINKILTADEARRKEYIELQRETRKEFLETIDRLMMKAGIEPPKRGSVLAREPGDVDNGS